MPWGAAAALGAAVIGSNSSDRASDKAADSAKKGIASTESIMNKARTDAINLFSSGVASSKAGTGSALNFYQNNAVAKLNPFIQGNVAAQQVLGQGATQANNAILGLPVDMNFARSQNLGADYSGIVSAKMPKLGESYIDQQKTYIAEQEPIIAAAQQAAAEEAANKDVAMRAAKDTHRRFNG